MPLLLQSGLLKSLAYHLFVSQVWSLFRRIPVRFRVKNRTSFTFFVPGPTFETNSQTSGVEPYYTCLVLQEYSHTGSGYCSKSSLSPVFKSLPALFKPTLCVCDIENFPERPEESCRDLTSAVADG